MDNYEYFEEFNTEEDEEQTVSISFISYLACNYTNDLYSEGIF